MRLLKSASAKAQCRLAIAYYQGDGVPLDKKQAIILFSEAAKQGHAEAQYRLAHAYYQGVVVPLDKDKARRWLYRAAVQGHAKAKNEIIKAVERRPPSPPKRPGRPALGPSLYEIAEGLYKKGCAALDAQNETEAIRCFREAAPHHPLDLRAKYLLNSKGYFSGPSAD